MTGKSHLTDIKAEDRVLLVSLPYRVGVWVSHADDDEGGEDDEKEMRVLEQTLRSQVKDGTVPFVIEVLSETLAEKDSWPDWESRAYDILSDCERAVVILEKHAGKEDQKAYRKTLFDIAVRVAGAHGEFGTVIEEENPLKRFWDRTLRRLSGDDNSTCFTNISAAEDAALQRLTVALHLKSPVR